MKFLNDGQMDKIRLPPHILNTLTDFSITIWMKVDQYSSETTPVISVSSSVTSNEISLNLDHVVLKGNNRWDFNADSITTLNQWFHFAFTRDAVNGELKIFLNGVERASKTGITNSAIVSKNVFIGNE